MLKTDVAIIGAGPGGLAMAHAISVAAPALKVSIFERTPLLQRRGAGLGLDINGQKALRAIKPELHDKFMSIGTFLHTSRTLRPDGTLISSFPAGNSTHQEYAKAGTYRVPCLLGWYEMQQMLLEQLPPSVQVHLGSELERYEVDEAAGTVTLRFNPHSPLPSATASLLVAADGYFSRVRQQCCGDGPPDYSHTIIWRARLPATTPALAAAGVDVRDGSSAMALDEGRLWFSYPISAGEDIVWTVSATDDRLKASGIDPTSILPKPKPATTAATTPDKPLADSQAAHGSNSSSSSSSKGGAYGTGAGTSTPAAPAAAAAAAFAVPNEIDTQGYRQQTKEKGAAAKARCLKALEGYAEPFLAVVSNTPDEQVVEHGLFTRPAAKMSSEAYGRGRVVVLGDAAHAMRPTGQGLNTAVEDCYQLGVALAGCSSGAAVDLGAVQRFRERQAVRLKPIMAHTAQTGAAAYKRMAKANAAGASSSQPTATAAAAAAAAAKEVQDPSGSSMTADQFSQYLYSPEWQPLSQLAKQAAAGH